MNKSEIRFIRTLQQKLYSKSFQTACCSGVCYELNEVESFEKEYSPCVLVIGAFDGFHRGHQTLIQRAQEVAHTKNHPCSVLLFNPDPAFVLSKSIKSNNSSKYTTQLLSIEDRVRLILNSGISRVYVVDFTDEFARVSYSEFCKSFLVQFLQVDTLVVGSNFKLGRGGAGTITSLSNLEFFEVVGLDLLSDEGKIISATKIREDIQSGNFEHALHMLGHPLVLEGVVVHGKHLGSQLGFPTANISCTSSWCIPKNGVYAGYVAKSHTVWPCCMHIGESPSFSDSVYQEPPELDSGAVSTQKKVIEAHLNDCSEDLYGKALQVFVAHKLGETHAFTDSKTLSQSIAQYKAWTTMYLGAIALGVHDD